MVYPHGSSVQRTSRRFLLIEENLQPARRYSACEVVQLDGFGLEDSTGTNNVRTQARLLYRLLHSGIHCPVVTVCDVATVISRDRIYVNEFKQKSRSNMAHATVLSRRTDEMRVQGAVSSMLEWVTTMNDLHKVLGSNTRPLTCNNT